MSEQFDVFLCHNSQDKPEVKEIARQLQQREIKPWLDVWELQPGLPWQRELEKQIKHIKSAAVFVGKSGLGPWQKLEIEGYLRRFVRQGSPVIPVLLSSAPEEPELPIFLEGMTWVDFRSPEAMNRLIWGITGTKPTITTHSLLKEKKAVIYDARIQDVNQEPVIIKPKSVNLLRGTEKGPIEEQREVLKGTTLMNRRKFLKWATFGSAGLVAALVASVFFKETQQSSGPTETTGDNKKPQKNNTLILGLDNTKNTFHIRDGKIYDANGEEFIARGVNTRHVWLDNKDKTPDLKEAIEALDNIASFGFNSVRIAWLVDHPKFTPVVEALEEAIQKTIDNKIVPMVELHDFTGSNKTGDLLDKGVRWWTDNADMWKRYEKYLMINIANQFGDFFFSRDNRPEFPKVYKAAITRIRNAGIKNLLIIDPFHFGKDYTLVGEFGKEIFEHDPLKNIAFGIHFECGHGTRRNDIVEAFDSIKSQGLPMIVVDFVEKHPPCGKIEYEFIMEQCQALGVGWYAWAWDQPDFSIVDPSLGDKRWEASSDDELSEFGRYVVNSENGTKKTSIRASIFE